MALRVESITSSGYEKYISSQSFYTSSGATEEPQKPRFFWRVASHWGEYRKTGLLTGTRFARALGIT